MFVDIFLRYIDVYVILIVSLKIIIVFFLRFSGFCINYIEVIDSY